MAVYTVVPFRGSPPDGRGVGERMQKKTVTAGLTSRGERKETRSIGPENRCGGIL